MVVAAVSLLFSGLFGCGGPAEPASDDYSIPCADDACRSERVASTLQGSFEAGIALLETIEDPVYLSLAINRIVSMEGSLLTPEQGKAVCAVAAEVMVQTHCERRFLTPHLRTELDGRPSGGPEGDIAFPDGEPLQNGHNDHHNQPGPPNSPPPGGN